MLQHSLSLAGHRYFPGMGTAPGVTSRAELWAGSAQRGTPKAMGCRGAGRDMALRQLGSTVAPLQL